MYPRGKVTQRMLHILRADKALTFARYALSLCIKSLHTYAKDDPPLFAAQRENYQQMW